MCRSSDDSPASSSAAFVAAAAAPTSHTGLNVSLQVVTSNHFFLLCNCFILYVASVDLPSAVSLWEQPVNCKSSELALNKKWRFQQCFQES